MIPLVMGSRHRRPPLWAIPTQNQGSMRESGPRLARMARNSKMKPSHASSRLATIESKNASKLPPVAGSDFCWYRSRTGLIQGEISMTRFCAAALLGASIVCTNAASAEVIDLSTWKCSSFLKADKDTVGVVLAWLDGYYQDENAPAVIDKDRFLGNAEKIGKYCAENPDIRLITATDKLFGSD